MSRFSESTLAALGRFVKISPDLVLRPNMLGVSNSQSEKQASVIGCLYLKDSENIWTTERGIYDFSSFLSVLLEFERRRLGLSVGKGSSKTTRKKAVESPPGPEWEMVDEDAYLCIRSNDRVIHWTYGELECLNKPPSAKLVFDIANPPLHMKMSSDVYDEILRMGGLLKADLVQFSVNGGDEILVELFASDGSTSNSYRISGCENLSADSANGKFSIQLSDFMLIGSSNYDVKIRGEQLFVFTDLQTDGLVFAIAMRKMFNNGGKK